MSHNYVIGLSDCKAIVPLHGAVQHIAMSSPQARLAPPTYHAVIEFLLTTLWRLCRSMRRPLRRPLVIAFVKDTRAGIFGNQAVVVVGFETCTVHPL